MKPWSLRSVRSAHSKIQSQMRLQETLSKFPKKRIVFTNGCFDLLHKGHVSYLERAKKLGDLLIVALNSDESIRLLKGPERPINPLRDRMTVLAALESVDFVTSFNAQTPLTLIQRLKPTILVKGGDWAPSEIVGASDVLAWGGQVYSLKFVQGRSTTRIIEKARSSG